LIPDASVDRYNPATVADHKTKNSAVEYAIGIVEIREDEQCIFSKCTWRR